MITLDVIAPGVLKIVAPAKLSADDFAQLAPKIDSILKHQGEIRVLVDATQLEGWDNVATLEKHAAFVKASGEGGADRRYRAARLAALAGGGGQSLPPSTDQGVRQERRRPGPPMDHRLKSEGC
jgi:hypothetical protein